MAPARLQQPPTTGLQARQQCRTNTWDSPTPGIAPGHLQANLLILPQTYAEDFIKLCTRNTVPCPLLASSAHPGDYKNFISHLPGISGQQIVSEIDIRTDLPRYNVYIDGQLIEKEIPSIETHWDVNDHVAFLIGCSFSFESALTAAGLMPLHIRLGRVNPIYRTTIPLCPSGVFSGACYVVSMRLYKRSEVERVREITRPYVSTHGEPVAWGWDGMKELGIPDHNAVDWGDVPVDGDGCEVSQEEEESKVNGLVPVFWGCGVTPQEAVMKAKIPGVVMSHAPAYMLVLDVEEGDVLGKT